MDRSGFESQHVPSFYLFSKCPKPLHFFEVFKRTRQKLTRRKIVKLAKQPALEKKCE
jgi:hypothetical protein